MATNEPFVAVYETRRGAEDAVKLLQRAGFDAKRLSILGGANFLAAGLDGLGIPKNRVLQYERALKADKFVLVARGSPAELSRAQRILCEDSNRPAAVR
jgi:hypothetical protein